MKTVFSVPQDGQFVAVWVYDSKIWSGTFLWEDGILYEYDTGGDDFLEVNNNIKGTAWGYDSDILDKTQFFVGEK